MLSKHASLVLSRHFDLMNQKSSTQIIELTTTIVLMRQR
jgi:hypothetical protein